MAILRLKRFFTGIGAIIGLFALLLVSLAMMSAATQNSEEFGRLYFSLLVINVLGLIALVVLIGANLARLVRQYRNKATGSRLTVRLVVVFVLVALVPVSVVYYFSIGFIQRGIDSWFDVEIEQAFDDALALSRLSLDERKREYLRRTRQLANELATVPAERASILVNDLRIQNDAYELTLLSPGGRIIASSSASPLGLVPHLPPDDIVRQVRQGTTYIGLDPIGESGLFIRILQELPGMQPILEPRLLQALYPVSGQMSVLADSVHEAASRYKQLAYLRDPLKFSFTLTLSLVLLLSLLSAVWAGFFSARRLVAPIRVLAIGTRAVASGDYDRQLPQHSSDELGFLVRSFNDMTRRLAQARDEARQSQQQAEGERAYLRAVLGRLSSGVLTLDRRHIVRTANAAAGHILGIDPKSYISKPLVSLATGHEHLRDFVDAIRPHLGNGQQEWRKEVVLFGPGGRQALICGGAPLPGGGGGRWSGNVIVFDDVTALIQAQRDAAWGEVARRLAHEIKNPLTPIRLSAERLRRKYLNEMGPEDAEVLDRATHTIVQQVEVMKEMVKAFSDYARTPQLDLRSLDFNILVSEVLDLYSGASGVQFETRLDPHLPRIRADSGRMRQLLHNVIKNSIEAADGQCRIMLQTDHIEESGAEMVELRVQDNGPGLPADMVGRFFEPYVTTKPKGTGLGLAIVKKIVEEHAGAVWAENVPAGGARVVIRFPLEAAAGGRGGPRAVFKDEPGSGQAR